MESERMNVRNSKHFQKLEENSEAITQMHNDGKSFGAIAKETGIVSASGKPLHTYVKRYIYDVLGLEERQPIGRKRKEFSGDQIQDIIDRYQSGSGVTQIATAYNVSVGVIRRVLNESGISMRSHGKSAEAETQPDSETVNMAGE